MHIVEEVSAQKALDAACDKWDGAQTAWDAGTWAIMHDPEIGRPLSESGGVRVAVFDGARSIKMPTVTIIYENLGDTIVVHGARFEDAKYGQSGRA